MTCSWPIAPSKLMPPPFSPGTSSTSASSISAPLSAYKLPSNFLSCRFARGLSTPFICAHSGHHHSSLELRCGNDQLPQSLLIQILRGAQLHMPHVLPSAFQQSFRIRQRRRKRKTERHVLLAHHVKRKWILGYKRRHAPCIHRLLRPGH